MIRRPPRSTQSRSSAASDVYKRQGHRRQWWRVGKRHPLPYALPYVHGKNDRLLASAIETATSAPCLELGDERGAIDPRCGGATRAGANDSEAPFAPLHRP